VAECLLAARGAEERTDRCDENRSATGCPRQLSAPLRPRRRWLQQLARGRGTCSAVAPTCGGCGRVCQGASPALTSMFRERGAKSVCKFSVESPKWPGPVVYRWQSAY